MEELFDELWAGVPSPAVDIDTDHVAVRPPTDPQQLAAMNKIEAVLERIVDSLANNDKQLTILLKREDKSALLRRAAVSPSASVPVIKKKICFPGRTPEEAGRFTVFVRILELMHEAIATGVVTTKRDIYYKDPALFRKQSVVDRYVEDIAFTFNVPRSALCVAAAAKGLFAGAITISKEGNQVIDGRASQEGHLIPNISIGDELDIHEAKWVLIIEKEAVFHSLVTCAAWPSMSQQGIIITGKGYPDLATRMLCNKLACYKCKNADDLLPIHALVDWDPDGLGILSSYKHGSASSQQHDNPTVPRLHWLGLTSEEVCSADDDRHNQELLPLTARDRRKASKMLEWQNLQEDGIEAGWRRELQVMLTLNYKAEIQRMDEKEGGVQEWLKEKLSCAIPSSAVSP